MSCEVRIPTNSAITVVVDKTLRKSLNLDESASSTTYVTSGLAGTLALLDSDGDTVTSSTTWTYVTGSDGKWYASLGKQTLTIGAKYYIDVTITSPVDWYDRTECVAVNN